MTASESMEWGWRRYRRLLLWTAIVFMAALALLRMGREVPRYFSDSERIGALDLEKFQLTTQAWIREGKVYGSVPGAVYPPASHLMFWPIMGWIDIGTLRVLWFIMMAAGLIAFSAVMICECGPQDFDTALLLALIPWAGYPASTTFLVGQLSIHVLFLLTLAMLRLARARRGWKSDAITAALLLGALVKPTTAAPFFWLAVFLPLRFRVAFLTASGYALLAALASMLRPELPQELHREWVGVSQSWTVDIDGHVHLHRLMAWIGLADHRLIGSMLVLGLFGVWVYFHRRAGFWTLFGVTAIVSRIWVYHRLYDDMLLFLAMIALWRLAASARMDNRNPAIPALLFAANLLCLLSPSSLLTSDSAVAGIMEAAIAAVWLGSLVFLGAVARREMRESPKSEKRHLFEFGKRLQA